MFLAPTSNPYATSSAVPTLQSLSTSLQASETGSSVFKVPTLSTAPSVQAVLTHTPTYLLGQVGSTPLSLPKTLISVIVTNPPAEPSEERESGHIRSAASNTSGSSTASSVRTDQKDLEDDVSENVDGEVVGTMPDAVDYMSQLGTATKEAIVATSKTVKAYMASPTQASVENVQTAVASAKARVVTEAESSTATQFNTRLG